MKFKTPLAEKQFSGIPTKLHEICAYFEELSKGAHVEPVVTRVKEGVCGDSGVHEAGRAVDFRNETRLSDRNSEWLYASNEVLKIVADINSRYPRTDKKVVCMHHSFQGMPFHFHIQIPIEWV